MAGSYTSLTGFFHWLFDNNDTHSGHNNDVCIIKDLLKLVRISLTCFMFMIIQTLLDESAAQALINSTIHYCAHQILATISLIPTPAAIICTFTLCFIFLPQIAQLISPIASRLQAYARKYFPMNHNKTTRRLNHAPRQQLTAPSAEQNALTPTADTTQLDLLKSQIEKITKHAMTVLMTDSHLNEIRPQTPNNGNRNGHVSERNELKEYCLNHVKAAIKASCKQSKIEINDDKLNNVIRRSYDVIVQNQKDKIESQLLPAKPHAKQYGSFHELVVLTGNPTTPDKAHSPVRFMMQLTPTADLSGSQFPHSPSRATKTRAASF